MQKSSESGVATHIGPESCGATRKGGAHGDLIVVRFADDIVGAFPAKRMPISFGRNLPNECGSSTWNCIPRRRDFWSLVRMRSTNESGVEKGGAMDGSRCCGKRAAK